MIDTPIGNDEEEPGMQQPPMSQKSDQLLSSREKVVHGMCDGMI